MGRGLGSGSLIVSSLSSYWGLVTARSMLAGWQLLFFFTICQQFHEK